MDLFVLDTVGDEQLFEKNDKSSTRKSFVGRKNYVTAPEEPVFFDEETDVDYCGLPPPSTDISHIISSAIAASNKKGKKNKDKEDYDSFAEAMGWKGEPVTKSYKERSDTSALASLMDDDEFLRPNLEDLKNSVLKGIEKKESIARPSVRQLAKSKKAERDKTKGKDWFNMPATEVTEEIENDLKILQMRSVLDPKHFYKKNDFKVIPKYFQVGTVQHSPLDYFKEKGERKNKKRTLVEELMADGEFQKFNKRKFKEVMEKRRKTGYHKANNKMKKLKKKKNK